MWGDCRLLLVVAVLAPPTASAFLAPAGPQLQSAHGVSVRFPQHARAAVRTLRSAHKAGNLAGPGDIAGPLHPIPAEAGAMQLRKTALDRNGMFSAASALASAAARGLWRRIQALVLALVLMVSSSFCLTPAAANADIVTNMASGKSHQIQLADGQRSEQASRKKLVLGGVGITSLINQVFDSLDSRQTGALSKDVRQ